LLSSVHASQIAAALLAMSDAVSETVNPRSMLIRMDHPFTNPRLRGPVLLTTKTNRWHRWLSVNEMESKASRFDRQKRNTLTSGVRSPLGFPRGQIEKAPETVRFRGLQVVAGARYARDSTLPMPLRLPVEGRVGVRGAAL
jgi:hypothetical protein